MSFQTKTRRGRVVLAALASASLAVSLMTVSSSASSAADAGTLRLALAQGGTPIYNPWGASNGINGTLWQNSLLYDSLVKLNTKGQPIPSLATSWTFKGNKVVTLKLRSGVKFDDGSSLDAAAVKANFDFAAANSTLGECNSRFIGSTSEVVSATEVKLTLASPTPSIIQDFGQCAGFIVNPKALADPDTLKTAPNGSGAYTLDAANTVSGQTWTFLRRAAHWDLAKWPFSKVVITFFADTTSMLNAGAAGQVDGVQRISPADKVTGLTVINGGATEYEGIYISDTKGAVCKPLGDVRVRQALNYAIDRAKMNKGLNANMGVLTGSTPFNSSYIGYSKAAANYYPYNPTKAKALLKAAGYAKGFTCKVLANPPQQIYAQAVNGFLKKVGVNLDISVHSTDFITEMFSGNWPMVTGNYTLGLAQMPTLKGILTEKGFWNPRHNEEPKFTALFKKIEAATTPAEQKKYYSQLAITAAQQAWNINAAIMPMLSAWNTSKLKVGTISGMPVPMIYNITPKA